jgi:hypothetical protein
MSPLLVPILSQMNPIQSSSLQTSASLSSRHGASSSCGCRRQPPHMQVKLYLCLVKHHAMKTYGGVEVYVHELLCSALDWRWVVHFTHRPLYTRYPLERMLGGPQSRPGGSSERKYPAVEGFCEYVEAIAESQQGVVLLLEGWAGSNKPSPRKISWVSNLENICTVQNIFPNSINDPISAGGGHQTPTWFWSRVKL